MNRRLDHVGILVFPFRECTRCVDFDVNDIIPFRNSGDVNPLATELFEIPVCPARSDTLKLAGIAVALVVVAVLEEIFKAKRLLMP